MAEVSDATIMSILADESTVAADIARRHGVSSQMVRQYKMRQVFRANALAGWMVSQSQKPIFWPEKSERTLFSARQVREIRASKVPSRKLAAQLGCSASMIRMIRLRKTYVEVED